MSWAWKRRNKSAGPQAVSGSERALDGGCQRQRFGQVEEQTAPNFPGFILDGLPPLPAQQFISVQQRRLNGVNKIRGRVIVVNKPGEPFGFRQPRRDYGESG